MTFFRVRWQILSLLSLRCRPPHLGSLCVVASPPTLRLPLRRFLRCFDKSSNRHEKHCLLLHFPLTTNLVKSLTTNRRVPLAFFRPPKFFSCSKLFTVFFLLGTNQVLTLLTVCSRCYLRTHFPPLQDFLIKAVHPLVSAHLDILLPLYLLVIMYYPRAGPISLSDGSNMRVPLMLPY